MQHIVLSKAERSELTLRLNGEQRTYLNEALLKFESTINQNYLRALDSGNEIKVKSPVYGLNDLLNSDLFARLISGKLPLIAPPPHNYGHPWYDLIEQEKAFAVTIGEASQVMNVLNLADNNLTSPSTFKQISVNQANWPIKSLNPAAENLLTYVHKAKEEDEPKHNIRPIIDCLKQKPEFILSHYHYGDFCLYLDTHNTRLTKDAINRYSAWYSRFCAGVIDIIKAPNGDEKRNTNPLINVKIDSWFLKRL